MMLWIIHSYKPLYIVHAFFIREPSDIHYFSTCCVYCLLNFSFVFIFFNLCLVRVCVCGGCLCVSVCVCLRSALIQRAGAGPCTPCSDLPVWGGMVYMCMCL